jgi:hypothetical protein
VGKKEEGRFMAKNQVPDALKALVDKFERNKSSYLDSSYIEEQVRREFIDPFFDKEILGWDVANRDGHAEAYKDVLHEGGIKTGSGKTRAPDYTFRIGGTRKFFVEAKKPSLKIAEDRLAAYQLRRYAWSAKLSLSILTSFNELAVYDCRVKPDPDDPASTARILYIMYDDYQSRWSEIQDIFNKESIFQGSFDRFAQKERHGTAQVDEAFLDEIERWREKLARNIALRNPGLNVEELNFTVQRTIDRIIFLRLCEDRGIESHEQLKKLLDNGDVYSRLCYVFGHADQKYNSGLFHFHKEKGRIEPEDTLTTGVNIDDDVLQEIISTLYYPKSPYEFSVLGVDILGSVYEQFLGKVIRLTEGHRAKIEEKPEVKKAGGVYYTPTEIVEYIVKNTVGKSCEGKSPDEVSKLHVLDPACGSGSFLIGAYTCLLNYHRDWYVKYPNRYSSEIYQGTDGQFYLTTREKKRILTNSIFGVDKDRQAVEVTKLNLLMKVLEGENSDTLERQQKLFHERALPDLGSNIKCGNSLIGPDFSDQTKLFDAEPRHLNPFNWHIEFAAIMKSGGFDIVIGNPPYLKIENIPQDEKRYFESCGQYSTISRRFDAFGLFLERSVRLLLKSEGLLGMIIPSVILNNFSFSKLRRMLLDSTSIFSVVNLGGKVFRHVNNDTLIMISSKKSNPSQKTCVFDIPQGTKLSENALRYRGFVNLKKAGAPSYPFEIYVTESVDEILNRIASHSEPLEKICNMFQGLVTGSNAAYIVDEQQIVSENLERDICKPIVFGEDVSRYDRAVSKYFVIYLDGRNDLSKYPNVARRLEPFKRQLMGKREVRLHRQLWWSLHWPREASNFERRPKILVQCIRNPALKRRVIATIDRDGMYADHALTVMYLNNASYDLRYVLGILNSELINFYFLHKYVGDVNIKGDYLRQVPIRSITFTEDKDSRLYKQLISQVDSICELNRQLKNTRVPDEKISLERQLNAADDEIDKVVYELYDLTEEQVRLVKSGTPSDVKLSVR